MRLTPDALFGPTPLTGPTPSQVKLSPSGKFASFLQPAKDNRERLELWLAEVATGNRRRLLTGDEAAFQRTTTAEEKTERERRRLFAGGVTAYAWHPQNDEILIPANGAALHLRVVDGTLRELTPSGTRQAGIHFSPKGNHLSYVRSGDLYCRSLADGKETRLTHDGGGTVTNGLPEFIAQEEMHRFEGHWWSPDERVIAFARVDTAPVAETHRHEIEADRIDIVATRYPFAGAENAEVRLGLVDVASGETTWLAWSLATDDYLARVQFAPDGALYVQAQSRCQRRLVLRSYRGGVFRDVLTETSDTWINLHDNLTLLDDGRLLWVSERSGSAQLYAYRPTGECQALRTGLGRVDRILAATNETAWLMGWRDDPTTQHLYMVDLTGDGSRCRQLTDTAGWHEGVVNTEADVALATRATPDSPPTLNVVGANRTLAGGAITPSHPYHPYLAAHAPSTHGNIEHDGETLHYRLTIPSPFVAERRYPVIVHVYGGPGVQRVRREFPPLTLQLLAQSGFGVFELDNRGGANRAKAFEDAIHGRLGHVEVQDQLAGVRFLRQLAWVDAERIGVFGHSYGGYMTLMCLAQSDVFAAGVSVAPVTRWELYDTHYTERYLGTPADNPEGYQASSVLPLTQDIRAPLLLMHGMADDNVLFTHSTALMRALQDAGKPFELMTYPGAKHGLQEPSVAIHRYRCIVDFLKRTLAAPRIA